MSRIDLAEQCFEWNRLFPSYHSPSRNNAPIKALHPPSHHLWHWTATTLLTRRHNSLDHNSLVSERPRYH